MCPNPLFQLRMPAHLSTYRAVLDNSVNHNAHAKFARKELDKLTAGEKQYDAAFIEKTFPETSAASVTAGHVPSAA